VERARSQTPGELTTVQKVVHRLLLLLIVAGTWLLLSGHFDPLLLSFGILSIALTLFLSHRMNVLDSEGHPLHITHRIIAYLPWLTWEVIKASFDVGRRVIAPKPPISPLLFRTPSTQKTDVGQVLFAN